MGGLGLEKATMEPRATDHIPEMIRLVSTLVENGYAYQGGSDVYFSVGRFKEYGKLSKRNLEEMQAGARVEIDEKKENPLDFVLWKGSKPGEPFWESPWGKGRPGWHIECSVMSMKYLGETFDIHGGGKDLVFPHHENEIAQSEGATGKIFARYWIHNGFINIDKEKMSKSLGNFLTIKDVLKQWHPEVLRLFFLSSHYRSPLDYTEESLKEAKSGLDRFYSTLKAVQDEIERPAQPKGKVDSPALKEAHQAIESFEARFEEAMDDDFNTAQALGYFFDLQTYLNGLLNLSKGRPTEEILSLLKKGSEYFSKMGWIFGLFRDDPESYLNEQRKAGLKKLTVSEEEILKLIEERNAARKEKNWKRADEVRNELLAKGIVLEDTPSGTNWKLK
jgi:cysteinyl-tRNA synthetase